MFKVVLCVYLKNVTQFLIEFFQGYPKSKTKYLALKINDFSSSYIHTKFKTKVTQKNLNKLILCMGTLASKMYNKGPVL